MKYLVLSGISWTCPGAIKVLGLSFHLAAAFPATVKAPLGALGICAAELVHEEYAPADRPRAEARARETGYRLEECRLGRGCRRLDSRDTILSFLQ